MTPAALSRLRAICLALPEAVEKETWDAPTFRIRDKIFAMVHAVDGRASVWCKAPFGAQAVLTEAAPERFFRPPYVGHKGWIGFWLDAAVDWDEAADVIGRSYRMTAPKRLLGTPTGRPTGASADGQDGPRESAGQRRTRRLVLRS